MTQNVIKITRSDLRVHNIVSYRVSKLRMIGFAYCCPTIKLQIAVDYQITTCIAICVHVITDALTMYFLISINRQICAKLFQMERVSSNRSQVINCTTTITDRKRREVIIISNNEQQTIKGKQDTELKPRAAISAYQIITICLPTE